MNTYNLMSEPRNVYSITEAKKNTLKYAALAWATICLIIVCVVTVTCGGIKFYEIYSSNKAMEKAVQYATDHNYELEMKFTNNSKVAFNLNKGNKPSLSLNGSSSQNIRVVPRNSIKPYFRNPAGTTITINSTGVEM